VSFPVSFENALSSRICSIKGFRNIPTMKVSVFYTQDLLKWIPAEQHYQIKISMNPKGETERERSLLGFVKTFI
jgi:hypothetical protein